MAQEEHHRKSDGATIIKILATVLGGMATLFVGVIAYVYTTDRNEFKGAVTSIASDVGDMREQQIINSAYLKNMEARVGKNTLGLEELHREARVYWRKP